MPTSHVDTSIERTEPFSLTSADYMQALTFVWLSRYGWWVAAPLILCAAYGVVADVRFVLIAVMAIFIVCPMVMGLLFSIYALTPEALLVMHRKEVHICQGKSITVHYLPNSDDDQRPIPPSETILWSDISKIYRLSRQRVFVLHSKNLRFVSIKIN